MSKPKQIQLVEQDLLLSDEAIIAHCCNTKNTMNSGIAKSIKAKFPEVYEADTKAYKAMQGKLLGLCVIVPVTDKESKIKYVANIYGQKEYGYDGSRYIDYEGFYQGVTNLANQCKQMELPSIGFPYRIGCDRAGGSWLIVLEMIRYAFQSIDTKVTVYSI